jgi:hypothetical protein
MTLQTPVVPAALAVPAKKSNKPAIKRGPAPSASAEAGGPKAQPEKALVRTLLVASCGWPTEADLPRRRATKR